MAKVIEKKVALLLKDPYRHCKSELLVRNLFGLRSARLTRNIRILFVVVEECRRLKWPPATEFLREATDHLEGETEPYSQSIITFPSYVEV